MSAYSDKCTTQWKEYIVHTLIADRSSSVKNMILCIKLKSKMSLPDMFTIYETEKLNTYKGLIVHVVLYGCEIWSCTLRDRYRLR
jgi:hypothetical protein